MLAAGPAPRHANPSLAPVLTLLAGLGSRPSVHDLAVSRPGFALSVRRG
jgi:oxaloacetate decarboxylase alpha subunit